MSVCASQGNSFVRTCLTLTLSTMLIELIESSNSDDEFSSVIDCNEEVTRLSVVMRLAPLMLNSWSTSTSWA